MDRFIAIRMINLWNMCASLKSNMDRFIGCMHEQQATPEVV